MTTNTAQNSLIFRYETSWTFLLSPFYPNNQVNTVTMGTELKNDSVRFWMIYLVVFKWHQLEKSDADWKPSCRYLWWSCWLCLKRTIHVGSLEKGEETIIVSSPTEMKFHFICRLQLTYLALWITASFEEKNLVGFALIQQLGIRWLDGGLIWIQPIKCGIVFPRLSPSYQT